MFQRILLSKETFVQEDCSQKWFYQNSFVLPKNRISMYQPFCNSTKLENTIKHIFYNAVWDTHGLLNLLKSKGLFLYYKDFPPKNTENIFLNYLFESKFEI